MAWIPGLRANFLIIVQAGVEINPCRLDATSVSAVSSSVWIGRYTIPAEPDTFCLQLRLLRVPSARPPAAESRRSRRPTHSGTRREASDDRSPRHRSLFPSGYSCLPATKPAAQRFAAPTHRRSRLQRRRISRIVHPVGEPGFREPDAASAAGSPHRSFARGMGKLRRCRY